MKDVSAYWSKTPLSAAAQCGGEYRFERGQMPPQEEFVKIAKILLEHGATVNTKEKYGSTPLTWAVDAGCKEMVELLIEHGAKIHWTKESPYDRDPPIYIAREKKFEEIQRILEKALHKRLNSC